MTSTRRCQKCGLTQFDSDVCRRCDTPLVEPRFSRPRPSKSGSHPIQGIWFSPRETIRSLVATNPTRGVITMTWLAGVALFVDGLMPKVQPKFPVGAVILGALLAGPLVAFFLVFLEALLAAGTGRLLGGRAGPLELRAALAWAHAPSLWLLVLWASQAVAALPGPAVYGIGLAIYLWVEVLAVVLVAEVHGFSIGRSVAAIFLAWLIKITVIVGIAAAGMYLDPTESPRTKNPEAATNPR